MQRIFPNASTEFRGKSQKNTAPSDLLIPAHLNQFIQIQIKKHKNLKNYFHYLEPVSKLPIKKVKSNDRACEIKRCKI
ncbi:DUF1564 family protein, partial [Leptospira borgpetersenii]